MIAASGFDGELWLAHWANDYATQIDINRMLGRPDFAFATLIG